ncbi:pyruvate kinase-like [Ostrea edulis]|uniref:pyruvate kinase-like n=1 Tax=Ostrea edulis TaxID=37623 RepID=UPI0024AEB105|nr:pyruvate kinase-like [Ostrea edulis]
MLSRRYQSNTRLEKICSLDIDKPVARARLTSIIGTIGPACDSVKDLRAMMMSGMTICRLNLAYRTHEYFKGAVQRIREAQAGLDVPIQVGIGIDITGTGIRVGTLAKEIGLGQELKMKTGDKMRFTIDEKYQEQGTENIMFFEAAEVFSQIKTGSKVIIEDGPLTLVIEGKGDDYVDCVVEEAGDLGSHMMWTIPNMVMREAELSEKDKKDLQFALDHDLDMVFASWVWCPEMVEEVRKYLGEKGKTMKIMAKIETYTAVKRVDEILAVADGLYIARGNLGVNISPEKVFLAQKMIIGKANKAGKPVICATQMLGSMMFNPRPTRAEVADVANAILDGADCVMLSRETARGKHAVKSMQTMSAVCREAEAALFNEHVFNDLRKKVGVIGNTHTTAIAAVEAAHKCQARAIMVVTVSGRSPALISKYRPNCVILAITRSKHTANNLQLHRGVFPVFYKDDRDDVWVDDVDARLHCGMTIARQLEYIKSGDMIVLVTGWTSGAGSTNTIRIISVPSTSLPVPYARVEIDTPVDDKVRFE